MRGLGPSTHEISTNKLDDGDGMFRYNFTAWIAPDESNHNPHGLQFKSGVYEQYFINGVSINE